MSDHEDDDGQRKTVVHSQREMLFNALVALDENKPDVSGDVKHQVGVAMNSFRRALRQHRDEDDALKEPWDDRGVDVIEQWMNSEVTVEVSVNRRGAAHKEERVLAIRKVPVRQLEAVAQELLDIGKELDFAESIPETTPSDEPEMGDLRELLKSRGQTEALENLPGDASTDEAGGAIEVND